MEKTTKADKAIEVEKTTITSEMLEYKLDGIKVRRTCQISRDNDDKIAGISKTINLVFDLNGATLVGICQSAVKPEAIKYQNSHRASYDKLEDGMTVNLVFGAAGQRDVMEASKDKARVMTPEARAAYIAELQAIDDELAEAE